MALQQRDRQPYQSKRRRIRRTNSGTAEVERFQLGQPLDMHQAPVDTLGVPHADCEVEILQLSQPFQVHQARDGDMAKVDFNYLSLFIVLDIATELLQRGNRIRVRSLSR